MSLTFQSFHKKERKTDREDPVIAENQGLILPYDQIYDNVSRLSSYNQDHHLLFTSGITDIENTSL